VRRVFSGGKHLGLREHVRLRGGTRERGSWLAQGERRESPALVRIRVGDHGMLEPIWRRGTSNHLVMRRSHARRGGGPSLQVARPTSAHRHRFNLLSAQPVAGSQRCPQAAFRRSMAFSVSPRWCVCSAREQALLGLRWLAARSSRKGWAIARRATSKEVAREARANAGMHGSKRAERSGGRGSDARGLCSRVIVVRCRSR